MVDSFRAVRRALRRPAALRRARSKRHIEKNDYRRRGPTIVDARAHAGSPFAGDSRAVRPLSSGGMGAVYVVHQERPTARLVQRYIRNDEPFQTYVSTRELGPMGYVYTRARGGAPFARATSN